MAAILRWYSEKARAIADGGTFAPGGRVWLQSVASDDVPLRFAIYERPTLVIARIAASLGLLRDHKVQQFMAVQVPGTTTHYSDQAWILPSPPSSRRRRDFDFRDDLGNRSGIITCADAMSVKRVASLGPKSKLDLAQLSFSFDVSAEDTIEWTVNPTVDPSVRLSVMRFSDEGRSMAEYLSSLVGEMAEAGQLAVHRNLPVDDLLGSLIGQRDQPTLQPLWDEEVTVDPEEGPLHLSLLVNGTPSPAFDLIAIEARSIESDEVLARSDPVLIFRPENGPLFIAGG